MRIFHQLHASVALLCFLALIASTNAEDRAPERKELWVPSKQLEEVLKQHPKAVLLDREQYEALIKDAGKVKPDNQEKPPLGAVFTGAKLEAHLVPGFANVTIKGLLYVTSFSDGWTELPALKSFERSLLTSITGDHIIAKNGNAKNEGLRIAVHGKGDHQIAVEFQSSVYRRNGYCYTFLPTPLQPLSLTARIEKGIHLARDWPEHGGVAIIPIDHTNSAYVLWTESAEKNRNDDSTLTQTIKAVTVLGGSELNTHLQVHLESKGNSMPQNLSFQLPDAEVNVVTLEGSGIASWKQSGGLLEVKLDATSQAFRADFTATLNRGAPALEKPADIPLDLPRLIDASRISVQSAISVGSGFEMLGYQTPGDTKDADAASFEKYASSIGPISAKANYAQLPSKLAIKVRRLSDLFSADVDNLVTLSTHEMMMQRTIVVHGEEGRVNKVELTVPANEQFIGLGAASGEPVQWKQTSFQDQGTTLEVTWPNGLQKGQSTALWLTTRHELPSSLAAESTKPNQNAPGAKFTINNVLLPSATRIAGYVALNFDESWKVVTPEMSGLESRDARVTPVKGQMAWFTLRDYKLGIEIARNEPVLDAEVIAYALPRAKQVEIEGQFTLTVSRAPLRKFDVKLPVSSAKLLRVDSPLIGEQQLDEATGVWHFTLRKELQGTANVRWRLNEKTEDQRPEEPNAENPKLKIQNPKLAATLPRFEFPTARRFTGEWVIEANTDTELSYDTKGVQPLDSTHAPAVEGYQPRHRVLAAFAYGAAAHEVKITATRHEASALISAVVEQMNLTSVLSSDGNSLHEAALIVKHNGQQFFGLRLPKGAVLLSAAVAGNAVKPVRAGDEEVRVPLSGGSAQSGSLTVKFVYEMTGNKWGSSGKQQLEPPSVGENVPVLSASWKVYAPEGIEYQTSGGLSESFNTKPTTALLGGVCAILSSRFFNHSPNLEVDFLPSGKDDEDTETIIQAEQDKVKEGQITKDRLNKCIIPVVQFAGASIEEAIEFMKLKLHGSESEENADLKKIQIFFNQDKNTAPSTAAISLELRDVPFVEALNYITELAGMKYVMESNTITILPISNVGTEFYTRIFEVTPEFLCKLTKELGGSITKAGKKISIASILQNEGVAFPEGSSAIFNAVNSKVVVKNTQPNLDNIEAMLAPKMSPEAYANAFASYREDSNVNFLAHKMSKLIFPEVHFSGASIEEAIEFLRIKSKDLDAFTTDPTKRGVNLILKPDANAGTAKITLDLKDVPMDEALRYITELSGTKYKVEPSFIVIIPITDVDSDKYTRTFLVPPNFIESSKRDPELEIVKTASAKLAAFPQSKQSSSEDILSGGGISFPDGASAVFIPATNEIIVKNTSQYLDAMNEFVQALWIQYRHNHPSNSKSGLISLDLTLPISGAFFEFSGHQKPETLTLSYQSWERQMFKAVIWILVGVALFLRWGRRRAWTKTITLVLLLTCVPLIIALSWLVFCNALLAGWLMAFGGWMLLGIAKWVEAKASSFGFRGSLRESFMVVLLTTLCSSVLHAELPETKDPAAHTVIVPYDIGKPLDLKQSNRFYLDYAEFQHLWDLAKENRRPAKPIVEAGPQEAIINSALYDAEILADRFVMNARLSVVTRGGSWVKLPLGFKADGLFISEVKVDGKSAVLEKDEALIEQPGPHMVEVSLQVLKKAGWQDLRMELPKSPANLIALTISEQEGRPSFNSFDFMVTEDKRAGRRVFILPMIMNSPLEFKREPVRQFVAEADPTSSENKVSLNVLPRLEKVSAEIGFAFAGKERSSFRVRFDGSLKPTLWQVSYLKQWMLRKDGRDWVADITLTRPVADKFQIRLDAERIFAESTGSREAPRVVGDAVKTTTLFSIDYAEDLTVKTLAASSIQRTDVANNKSGAKSNRETYRWLNNEPLSYLVANAEDRSASQIEAVYQLSAQKAEIIAAITLETGRGPLAEARVKLPQGFEVQSLAGPRVLSWHREGDEVLMLFDSQEVSNARLVVHVAKTLTKTTNTWKLESLLTPRFAKHKGTALIATHAADEVTLSFDASDRKLREVDPSTLNAVITVAAPLVVKRALLTEKSNWSAQVGLNRQSPKFSVDAVLLAQATDEGLKLSQQIGLNIEQGAVGGVKLRLPKELPEARVRGALVRDAQSKLNGELREYEVKFQEDVLERADFTLDLELPLEGEKTLPVVQVDGASRAQRFLIVDNTSSKEMKTDTGGAEPIIKNSLPYLPDGLQRPEYYRAGDTAKIKLGFNQLETTAGNAAIITLAEITTALRENGERWETVVYSIANRALQFLPVRLPANAELVEVSVGGQTVRADVDGSKKASGQVYLVPLIQMRAGELSQQVRLVYRLGASEKSVVTKHTLDDPELVGLSAERTLWNVWLPEPFELKKWNGNMEDVGEEGREVEKQQSLLSDLNRLNQVLSSKDLKAEDANVAWANANKVVGELKHQQQEKKSKKSYFSRSDEGKAKELPQQAARQSIAIANAEVDKQLDVQGSLLIGNSSNVLRAQSQVEQGRNTFVGIVQGNINSNSGATQNWAFNGGNLTVQPKSEAKPTDMNQLAVNDNVNIGQGFLDDKGAASMKNEPQGATLTKSGAGTLTLGSGVATLSGGLTLATPTQNASQSGLQNNATNNISSNARASKNAITANSATSLDLNGTNTYTGGTTINAGTTVNRGTLNINGNVAGTGGVILAGNGKLELGDNDGASKELQNALGIDKDDKALRRGMETAEQAKSQYYKTAKDQIRASTLTGVSEGGESKVPVATLNLSGAVATGSIAATPDSIDGLLPKIATSAPAKPSVVKAIGISSASAATDPFAAPATGNSIVSSSTLGTLATSNRAAVAAPPAGAGETESRNKALPATPQLKPVGRVSLAVEVPLEGTVHHFRKLKDHALIELTVIKPMESRQTSALWMLVIGGAILGGIEWLRRWRAVK